MLQLIEEKRFVEARRAVAELNEVDLAAFITENDDNPRTIILFRLLPKELAAEVFAYLEGSIRQKIVEAVSDRELSGILDELFMDDTVDFLEEMPASIVKRVIKLSGQDTRKHINQLLMYPEDSAGSIMTIELIRLDAGWNVGRALGVIRRQSGEMESISTLFVTDDTRKLLGTVDLKDVLSSPDDTPIARLMHQDVLCVNTHAHQEDVAERFKKYDLLSMPVVDQEGRLVGIITIDDVVDVMEEETTEDIYKMAAMAPPEAEKTYLDTGAFTLAKKRVVWLLVLMISATFTGIIIQRFNDALSANVLLASFIPMLMDTSGNAGSQSSVSIIRSLVLREVRFGDIFKVIWKEFQISLLVGVAVAVVNFARIWVMNGDYMVAAVVSATLVVAIMAAKFVGCTLPLLADKCKLDPAIMASPLITTIVDAVALLVFFNVATAVLGV